MQRSESLGGEGRTGKFCLRNSIKTVSQGKLLFDLVLKGDRCLLSNEVRAWYAGIWEGQLMFLENHREADGAEGPYQRWAPARRTTMIRRPCNELILATLPKLGWETRFNSGDTLNPCIHPAPHISF